MRLVYGKAAIAEISDRGHSSSLSEAAVQLGGNGQFLFGRNICVAIDVAADFLRDHPDQLLGVTTEVERRDRACDRRRAMVSCILAAIFAMWCVAKVWTAVHPFAACVAMVLIWTYGENNVHRVSSSRTTALSIVAPAILYFFGARSVSGVVFRAILTLYAPHCCSMADGCKSGCTCNHISQPGYHQVLCDVSTCSEAVTTMSSVVAFAAAVASYAAATSQNFTGIVPWMGSIVAASVGLRMGGALAGWANSLCLSEWN